MGEAGAEVNQIRAISYGGGVQSTAMLVLAARKEIDYRLALFSNVGDDSEHPDTLMYFRNVAVPYAERMGIELVELRRTGRGSDQTLYQKLMKEGSRSVGIPVRMSNSGAPGRRQCTADFKIRRVASELRRRGASAANPALVALGISIDEYQRMRTESGVPEEKLDYPLIHLRLNRADCMRIIEDEGLPVPPKSSCFFCPFHSMSHWKRMRMNEPELFARAAEMERVINERREDLGKDPVWFTAALRPLNQVVGLQLELDEEGTCDTAGYCMV
jgi:hypothetical protein